MRADKAEDLKLVAEGKRYANRVSVNEIRALFELAASLDRLINSVEVYRIGETQDDACVDFTVTPLWFRETYGHLSWGDQITASRDILETTIAEAEATGGEFYFWAGTAGAGDWS